METSRQLRDAMAAADDNVAMLLVALRQAVEDVEYKRGLLLESLRRDTERVKIGVERFEKDDWANVNAYGLQSDTDRLMGQYEAARYAAIQIKGVCQVDPPTRAILDTIK